jgi:hypothetical protein
MTQLTTDSVQCPSLALPGAEPFRAAIEFAWRKLGKSHDATPADGHRNNDVPEEFEPGAPPVEPDEGPVPAPVPDDPEHDRVVDPAANLALQAQPTRPQWR